ncbi:MAG TPA: membrane protein insertion efficiency factor YidD [Usitatibacter sp.]|nr:membrane protein insertion efficiency factor YidD [Usitatibacter sp.]
MSNLLLAVIRGYRYLLSPWWGGQCRFTPTCSEYAMDAIHAHGALRGTWLAMRRVSKCHPWHHGGFDPAP